MTTLSPRAPGTGTGPSPGRHAADDPDMDALLDMLEERGVDPPSIRARARSIATAVSPRTGVAARRVVAAARRVAAAASTAVLLVVVSLVAVLVVAVETAARAVAACDLPRRRRTCSRVVAAWDVPGRARSWGGRARACADRVLAWPVRLDRPS